ncbi:hypothetical protein ACLMJK_008782 [Lecanora helva]
MGIQEVDYIIVGGGLTGCAIASRLRQNDATLSLLVLEAGENASDNPKTRDLAGAFELQGSSLDYDYTTTHQQTTKNRTHAVTAGRGLGGGSILNYGYWARGDASDYDQWAATVGDDSWSFKGLLPYMKRAESHYEVDADPENRGSTGPIRVTSVPDSDPKRVYGLREPIKAAWEDLGLTYNAYGDCGSLAGICEFRENWRNGERQPSHLAYRLDSKDVITNALVHKVSFSEDGDGLPRASGVLLADGRCFRARKEIILSAGAIKTPQILMLSGIGPDDVLKEHHIPVLYNNQEVGKNYFDHFALFQTWKLRNSEKGLSMGAPQWTEPALFKGMPCDWAVNEGTPQELLRPALQADAKNGKVFDPSLSQPTRCHTETLVIYSPMGAPVPIDGSWVGTSVMLLVPTSRGIVTLKSSSPNDSPEIDPNFYSTEFDRTALIYGARRLLKAMLATPAGKTYIEFEGAPPGMTPLTEYSSDDAIDERIKMTGKSHAHSAGTSAMGKVVDTQLRVKGVKGLRVADASVLPVAIGGHPQATLYGVAEKAAEMILIDSKH